MTSDGIDQVPWISYLDDTVLRQSFGDEADTWDVDLDDDYLAFLDASPVGADAAPAASQPPDDAWDWSIDEPPSESIEIGYQNSDLQPQYFGEDADCWDVDLDDDDWVFRDTDSVGADAPLATSQPPDDVWDWSAEEPDQDERDALGTEIVGADAPQYFGEDSDLFEPDFDEEATLHIILDDSDDAVDSTTAYLPPDDAWDWSLEDPDQDERDDLGTETVSPNAPQYFGEDADQWDHDLDDDLWYARDSDPVGPDPIIVGFSIADDWDWTSEIDDDFIVEEFSVRNPDAPQYFGEDADSFDHEVDDDSWHSRDSDIVGASAPQYFGEDADQWEVDLDDDSWTTVQGDSDVISRNNDLFQYFGEDAESWELDPDDFYYVADDYQLIDFVAGLGSDLISDDAWDWTDEDLVTNIPDSYQNIDYVVYEYHGEDTENWDVDQDDDDWVFRDSDIVGADGVQALDTNDWDWNAEETAPEAFETSYQNSDGAPQYYGEDTEAWAQDIDDETWAVLGTDIVGADGVQAIAPDEWDWSAEEPDQDDRDHRPDEGIVGADAVPNPIVDDWDYGAEEPDQDDHDHRPSDSIVGPDVGPYPTPDDFDWAAEEPDADERDALGTDPVGPDAEPFPASDDWDWSAEEPDADERDALGTEPVGPDAPQYFSEDADVFDVDLDDDDWLTRDTDAIGTDGTQMVAPDDWDWWGEETLPDAIEIGYQNSDAPQYFGETADQWDHDLDDDDWLARDSDPVGAGGAQAVAPDEWDWSAEEPDQDFREALGTDPVGASSPQYFGETADQWDHDLDDEIWAVLGNDPVGRDGIPVAQPDPWDWSAEEPEDDLRAFMDVDPVGLGAAGVPAFDPWDWAAEEPEDDLRAFLDTTPVGASAVQYFGEAADQWDHDIDDDSWHGRDSDIVGKNASPFPFPDVWDWSAEEPEDDIRIAIENQQVGANGVPSLFADGWDWFSEDGMDVAGESEVSGPVRQDGGIVFAEPLIDWSDTGDADDLAHVAQSQPVAELNYRRATIFAPPRNHIVTAVPRGDQVASQDRTRVVTAQSRADDVVAPAVNPIIPS